jgi:hypothetical protein
VENEGKNALQINNTGTGYVLGIINIGKPHIAPITKFTAILPTTLFKLVSGTLSSDMLYNF